VECSSPYNTPILAVRKWPNKWRLVQDLWLINEVVSSFHPIVPNPYTLLAQIPSKAQYYSILDLKDAFFCIPLYPDSLCLPLKTPLTPHNRVLLEQHKELGSLGTTSADPLFMLLLIFLFGPCIINALSRFISQQVQQIKFQLLVKKYSPLLTHDPSVQFY
jgi:hypothetical protein